MPGSPDAISVRAYAKINLGLAVLGPAGDGYHLVRSLMQLIDLHDTLTFRFRPGGPSPRVEIECVDPGVPSGNESEDNLVARALRAAGVCSDVSVTLDKRIPVGSGLGGGSSDAAAALMAAARTCCPAGCLDVTGTESLAAGLGADVPFFLQGGTQEATGRGEILRPVPFPGRCRVLLMCPPVHVGTADVYRMYDRLTGFQGATPAAGTDIVSRLRRGEVLDVLSGIHNDLQEPAFRCHPELREWSDAFGRAVDRPVVMTGSGSCFYTLYGEDEDNCHEPQRALRALEDRGAHVFRGSFRSGRGWEFIDDGN